MGPLKHSVALHNVWIPVIIQNHSLIDVQQSSKTAVSRHDATARVNVIPNRYAHDRPAALDTVAESSKAEDTGAVRMTVVRPIASDTKHEPLF